jgi:putative tryptophan/tyrosine transport system substrate-binding protein
MSGNQKAMKCPILALTLALSSWLFAPCFSAQAQQSKKVPLIGLLASNPPAAMASRINLFRQGLRELKYEEGQNITVEYRYAEGDTKRFTDFAVELVRLKPDVIVAISGAGALAAKAATRTIPIIFLSVGDPVADGLVSSFSHPGGNITGLTNLSLDLGGKRLELLNESFPKATRVAYLWNPDRPARELQDMQSAAKAMAVHLLSLEVRGASDFDSVFALALRERIQALMTWTNPLFSTHRDQIINFTAKNRLPSMFPTSEFVNAGGLMSYGPDTVAAYRRAATYVYKILNGAKPADLPVEQPTKFEFEINLKTAKQIGVAIPPEILARANRIIK